MKQALLKLWQGVKFLSGVLGWPLIDPWRVAGGARELSPARKAIGWLAGIAIAMYIGIALSIYAEKWGLLIPFGLVFLAMCVKRSQVWSVLNRAKGGDVRALNEYFHPT
ncbi:MAG: hypothetical protein UY44_C0017G0015 [Candidatus Kaiserbacteria bacterium GW2011_GWA2_49_19]|uniref:Uncharacterized protein n=1 Tax=Candidatus Kaiserbacteria bacterium GW2011_GWA2_49_19 TaxID=1618669 RepID=A0A0G1XZU2_9BACT|nr:MAG: hypothetical protein UY44_C0017G0015 [Candidatus Kaiserbacteria bacterium GW2011_GWA2_49_19]